MSPPDLHVRRAHRPPDPPTALPEGSMHQRFNSPNGRVQFTVSLSDDGAPTYSISYQGAIVVEHSVLGFACEEEVFADHLTYRPELSTPARRSTISTEQIHGRRRTLTDDATAATITLHAPSGGLLSVDIRVYDDGAAFRYRLLSGPTALQPPHAGPTRHVVRELTTVTPAPGGRAWLQPTDPPGHSTPAHEAPYLNGIEGGSPSPTWAWELPATFETPGGWLLVSESDLDETFQGSRLGPEPVHGSYTLIGPSPQEGEGVGSAFASSTLPWILPWRVFAIAAQAHDLVGIDLVDRLARPTAMTDLAWIRPGRVSWSWWAENNSPQDLAALRRSIDFAAEMGWEYSLIDANWDVHSEADLRALIDYAGTLGVRIFLWYNSGGAHNKVTERPRDRMDSAEIRRAEFARLADWGVAGIKVDFFHTDKQDGIALYLDILRDAAQHRLLVNFHGCTIPRGWSRTWPHLLSLEAVRGAENYLPDVGFPEQALTLNTILPFTRNVIGPMDYTPVTFSDQHSPHLTSTAHELALAVVFESGLLHPADSPESYRRQHPEVVSVLRRIPVAWEESVGLGGEPGSHVVLARRSDSAWYLAGIAGETAREGDVIDVAALGLPHLDLSPSGSLGTWRILHDGDARDSITLSHQEARQGTFTTPPMNRGGGFVAILDLTPSREGISHP